MITEKAEPDDVRVVVRDSGPGLAPEVGERLFQAFYTTKSGWLGDGTVDLSVDHRSTWWAIVGKRERTRGAVFQFTLPPE